MIASRYRDKVARRKQNPRTFAHDPIGNDTDSPPNAYLLSYIIWLPTRRFGNPVPLMPVPLQPFTRSLWIGFHTLGGFVGLRCIASFALALSALSTPTLHRGLCLIRWATRRRWSGICGRVQRWVCSRSGGIGSRWRGRSRGVSVRILRLLMRTAVVVLPPLNRRLTGSLCWGRSSC
jgi:hypothetical protein